MREKVLEEKFGTLPDLSYSEKMIQIEFQIQSNMIIHRFTYLLFDPVVLFKMFIKGTYITYRPCLSNSLYKQLVKN